MHMKGAKYLEYEFKIKQIPYIAAVDCKVQIFMSKEFKTQNSVQAQKNIFDFVL